MSDADIKAKSIAAFCKVCRTRIRFDKRPELYDIVTCPECEEVFEVVRVSPVQIDWPSDFVDDEWPEDDESD